MGFSYSTMNTARSALSTVISIDGKPVGSHPLVIRLLKGAFNLRPALPKNVVTWDPELLINYLKKLSPVKSLSMKNLTLKAVSLLWILSGQRGQSMQCIDLRNLTVTKHVVKIRFGDILKSTRPGFQQKEVTIKAFAPDRRACLVTVLTEYINRTKLVRKEGCTQLFISFIAPFEPVSRDTIARWIKLVMLNAGVDLSIFTPHSVRGASTSSALRGKVPLQTILETAGWSKASTFMKYYNKPLKDNNFSTVILENSQKS